MVPSIAPDRRAATSFVNTVGSGKFNDKENTANGALDCGKCESVDAAETKSKVVATFASDMAAVSESSAHHFDVAAINGGIVSTPSADISSVRPNYYRRPLPTSLIPFNSDEGKQIFKECMEANTAECYFDLVGNFTTQSDPAFCGLGSLAMVLNALEMDPGKVWKGSVWRWYSDEMLACCSPLDLVRERGISFDEFTCLARCHRLDITAVRVDDLAKIDDFRLSLIQSARTRGHHLVTSFSRLAMGQTGDGHFSPIGAVHVTRNLALVLDVARFKYPSYWAPIDMLWNAMRPIDSVTSLPRGYFTLRRRSADNEEHDKHVCLGSK